MHALRLSIVGTILCGCATGHARDATLTRRSCAIVVYNQTPHALDIRMTVSPTTSVRIGGLNPGELLNYSLPCERGGVRVSGIPIPSQVGAPVSFRFVEGGATLVRGERVPIALHWP